MSIIIRPADLFDAFMLSHRLRASDRRELEASSGYPIDNEEAYRVLSRALQVSTVAWAACSKPYVEVLFGAAPLTAEPGCQYGSAWLLGSDWIESNPREFYRQSREYLARMHEQFLLLTNFVDDRNVSSQRWLRRLGFVAGDHVVRGGFPFTQFTSVREKPICADH